MRILQYNLAIILIAISGIIIAQPSMLNEDAVRNSKVSSYDAINSAHLDFSPVIYGEGLVFIGNKEKGQVFDQEINEAYFELKYLPLNSESASISDFSPALNIDDVHKGPCSFSQQDRVVYYTKEKRFRDDRDAVLKILKAYKDENDWIPDGEFPFNSDEFSNNANTNTSDISDVPDGFMGLDIGEKSIKLFSEAIENSKTIIWNGPMGVFEMSNFEVGTKLVGESICKATKNGAFSLIGGGDSVAAIKKFNMQSDVSYISTGGGAMLEYLEGKELPGVKAIQE